MAVGDKPISGVMTVAFSVSRVGSQLWSKHHSDHAGSSRTARVSHFQLKNLHLKLKYSLFNSFFFFQTACRYSSTELSSSSSVITLAALT